MIAVTQPRRVAATAMAARVAAELGERVGGAVGYQVRYDAATVGAATRIKFLTDGILLREIADDLLLRRYSAIVIDEAHERNVNTDVLLGMLSRAVGLRNELAAADARAYAARGGADADAAGADAPPLLPLPLPPLKLVIMSATLRVADFADNAALFPSPPPVLRVAARQFPVTVHFAKRTELHDYVGEAFRKTVRICTSLPAGGVLVFLTGQDEIADLVRRLGKRFDPRFRRRAPPPPPIQAPGPPPPGSDGEGEEALRGGVDDAAAAAADVADDCPPVHILPLFALLPRAAQMRVFQPPPTGHRLIVVATNVAETSLTIPGIRCVQWPSHTAFHAASCQHVI
jgi:ATP-dependent RNA helicase DHX37/DHR1